jgi:hypothetical protein
MSRRRADRPIHTYPAPKRKAALWRHRDIFLKEGVSQILERMRTPVLDGQGSVLLVGLNDAAVQFFRDAHRAKAPITSELETWAARVASTSEAFLAALGLKAGNPPQGSLNEALHNAFVTLTAWNWDYSSNCECADRLDPLEALAMAAGGAFVAHDLSSRAASYYASQKVDRQSAAKRKGLSPRQRLTISLARLYSRCFGEKVPKYPQPGASPFLRFVKATFDIIAIRMAPTARAIALPDDGSDAEAAKNLGKVNERQIAGDLKVVHMLIEREHGPLAGPPTPSLADTYIAGLPPEVREILERAREEVLGQRKEQPPKDAPAANASEPPASQARAAPKKKRGFSRS